jgi:hypothetical protein
MSVLNWVSAESVVILKKDGVLDGWSLLLAAGGCCCWGCGCGVVDREDIWLM